MRDLSNLPFTPEETRYTSYWGNLAEIQYAGNGQSAVFRKSAGTEDNSGDYESYRETADLSVQGNSVTLKGDGKTYALALWTDGTYAYSLRLSPGVPESAWAALISGARGAERRSTVKSGAADLLPPRIRALRPKRGPSPEALRRRVVFSL